MSESPIGFRPRPRDGSRGPADPKALTSTEVTAVTPPVLVTLDVTGMTCGHCAQTVTTALQTVPGVQSATASVSDGAAVITSVAGLDPARLVAAVRAAGYGADLRRSTDPAAGAVPAVRKLQPLHLGLGVMLTLWLTEWVFHLGHAPWYGWFSFSLALPVQIWLGGGFVRGAWRQLRAGRANMDTLVALGSSAAFGYSAVQLFSGGVAHLFFAEAVTILTFITLGHALEARLTERAGDAIRQLLELTPENARKILDYGTTKTRTEATPVAALRVGDVIELAPGDRVPVDAEVLAGESAVTEAMLTGEALPVEKTAGSRLYAGTLNQSGQLHARVAATGEATALAGIVAAVRRAQSGRAEIQRLADRLSSVFVPAVIILALAAAAWWGWAPTSAQAWHARAGHWLWSNPVPTAPGAAAFYIFCAVLIVACPCALGLATPMALLAGVNAGARRGILIRDAVALEKAGRIDTVAFDKTGTLTLGRPVVAEFRPITPSRFPPEQVCGLASAISRPSRHPLSRALAAFAPSAGAVDQWREVRGAGVRGRVTTTTETFAVALGAPAWLVTEGLTSQAAWDAWIAGWEPAATHVGIAVNGGLAGAFALADPLRPDAAILLARLAERLARSRQTPAGYPSLQILSGDRPSAVAAAAGQFQDAHTSLPLLARGGLSPTDKVECLRQLQAGGHRVAFVGDGLNDGPVLAQADLGLAVTDAAAVAREAADIVLLRPDLGAVAEALELAAATRRTIWQNLAWACVYNLAALPLAVSGLLHPVLCALAMGLSDVFVVGNALRLSRWRPAAGGSRP